MEVEFTSLSEDTSLKDFLLKDLNYSKNQIKKYFTSKKLKTKIKYKETIKLPINLLNNNIIGISSVNFEIEELFQDENFIILNKREGIHGHPIRYTENNTLLNFLRFKYSNLKLGIQEKNQERGLLYRLDYGTSGVIIYIKDKDKLAFYRSNFKELVLLKKYFALVEGNIAIDEWVINNLGTSDIKNKKVIESNYGKRCLSYLKTLRYIESLNSTLIEVTLKTGFRHQIRVQCSLLGHPILGDILYGGKESERIFLHAFEYKILFNLEEMTFNSFENDEFQKKLKVNCLEDFLHN